jgi:site-specific DNA recombinase
MTRVATYARYSSDQQRAASIADQQRLLREHCAREGWTIVAEFTDAAMSGATNQRPGYQAMMRTAFAGDVDVVLAESLDRFSRDQEDTAALYKRMRFVDVRIITVSENVIGPLHVGLQGTMNAMYLDGLGEKTHRGQEGNVLKGKIAGGNSYGYRVMTGRLGERELDEAQAAIVRRIFTEYVDGVSPTRITRALNAEGVSGPRGIAWTPSTIHGQPRRGTGILNNELYVGRLVWNRLKWVKHPDTRKRLCRLRPREAWKVVDVPQLRIISDELWDAAKARQARTRLARTWNEQRRPRHLFSGLTKCAVCDGGFTIFNHDNLFCFNARARGTCTNRRAIKRMELEARVLNAMSAHLLDPGMYEAFRAGYLEEVQVFRAAQQANRAAVRQQRLEVERRIREIVNAIADGYRSEALRSELAAQERVRDQLLRQEHPLPAVTLPRDLACVFRQQVRRFAQGVDSPAAREALRGYIARIVIPPDGMLRVIGDPAAMGLEPGAMVGCGGLRPTIPPELLETAA